MVIALLVLAFGAPLLARRRDRVVAICAVAYVIGIILVLVPLARLLGTYFAYRRVESLVPPLLLATAIGVVAIVDRLLQLHVARRPAFALGAAIVVVLVGFGLVATIAYYDTEKTNYRAFAQVVRNVPNGQSIVVGGTTPRSARLIRDYLRWKGVDRAITFIVPGADPVPSGSLPYGVTWLTGAPPNRADMSTKTLNDLDRMQVIAGDRSGLLVILPWFASTSAPQSEGEFNAQRDAIATLPPFLPAP